MSFLKIETDTWLDLTVNLVPLAILVLLELMILVYNPWGWDPVYVILTHALILVPIVVLSIVTYVSGRAVQRDEAKLAEAE